MDLTSGDFHFLGDIEVELSLRLSDIVGCLRRFEVGICRHC